jgi:hypothetical protein
MSAELGFVGFLLVTLALLGAVVWSGLKARRRVHIPCVAATLAALGITIYYAEKMGHHYDLASAGRITPVHLALAKLTTLAYLVPLTTGALTLRNAAWRPRHRLFALLVLALTVATAATGTWMVLAAERLPALGS